MRYKDLDAKVQDYLNERFSYYDRTGEEAFNEPHIFPDELKELEPDALIEFLEHKDISHFFSQSKFPELRSELENMILEDSSINRSRRSRTMTMEEKDEAMEDLLQDIKDGDVDDDGIKDLYISLEETDKLFDMADFIDELMFAGLFMTGIQVIREIKNGNVSIENKPNYITKKIGKRIVRLVIIGMLLKTKEPIIVTATVATIIYKNRDLLVKFFHLISNQINQVKNKINPAVEFKIAEKYGIYLFDLTFNRNSMIDNLDWDRFFHQNIDFEEIRNDWELECYSTPIPTMEELYMRFDGNGFKTFDKLFYVKFDLDKHEYVHELDNKWNEGSDSDYYDELIQNLLELYSSPKQIIKMLYLIAEDEVLDGQFSGYFKLIESFQNDETREIIFEAPNFEPNYI